MAATEVACGLLLASLTLTSCATPPSETDAGGARTATAAAPLANVDPETTAVLTLGARRVTLAELARVLGPPPQQRLRITEHERRVAFLGSMERTELLAFEAEQRGYLREPSLLAARKTALIQTLMNDLFGEDGTLVAKVTDAEVRARYEADLARWTRLEQVRARQLVVPSRALAERLLTQLTQPTAAHDPQDVFAKLAMEHSVDAKTKTHGGDLGWFTLHAPKPTAADVVTSASLTPPVVPESVRAAAFALTEPGQVAKAPIKSELGYHVVQFLARRPETRAELAQVSHLLGEELRDERTKAAAEAFAKALEDKAHVQVDTAALAKVRVTD